MVDILDDEDGLGITFDSDKGSTWTSQLRHRVVAWSFLPEGTKEIFEEYIDQRPKVQNFFVHYDGQPLTRDDFLNFFEPCQLQMRYRFLHFVPHSMRLGVPHTPAASDTISWTFSMMAGGPRPPLPWNLTPDRTLW